MIFAAVEAPAAGSRYLMQERYPQPGKGAPAVPNVTAPAPAPAAAPKKSSAGAVSGSTFFAAVAAAAAVLVL